MQKKWIPPHLTILVRNHPEESILTNCKGGFSGDSHTTDGNCIIDLGDGRCGGQCSSLASS